MERTLGSIMLAAILVFILASLPQTDAIGCYVCTSINGSHHDCEDTFNATNTHYYRPQCFSARKGRSGVFPGTECIKMTAHLGNYTIMVRDCTVDSGGINSDTELGRESHCWAVQEVKFNGVKMKGCTLACATAGCNFGNGLKIDYRLMMFFAVLGIVLDLLDYRVLNINYKDPCDIINNLCHMFYAAVFTVNAAKWLSLEKWARRISTKLVTEFLDFVSQN